MQEEQTNYVQLKDIVIKNSKCKNILTSVSMMC